MPGLKPALLLCLIFIIVFSAFLPSLKNGFLNWDDDIYVTANPLIRQLSGENIKRIFTPSTYTGQDSAQLYVPIAWLSYALEYHFFGLNPAVYHTTNLFLHAFNCLLVFWFLFLLSQSRLIAFIAAVIFGVHPLRVESVAWVTERKDVLFVLFSLSALISYLYYLKKRKIKFYYLTVLLFIPALLSKLIAATLPFLLLSCDYYAKGRINKRDLLEKAPLLLLTLAFTLTGEFFSHKYLVRGLSPLTDVLVRLSGSGYTLSFYLSKTLLPFKLSVIYPDPFENMAAVPLEFTLLTGLWLFTAILVFKLSARHSRRILFGSAFFLIALLPALFGLVNDRQAYLASVGTSFILAIFIAWLYRRSKDNRIAQAALAAAFIALISFWSYLSWNRCKAWKDNLGLWSDCLKNYPDTATAYNSRGAEYLEKKEFTKAKADFVNALRLDRNYYEAYFNLGLLYNSQGDHKEAVKQIKKALLIKPGYLKAYDALAAIYIASGSEADVVDICRKAIRAKPTHLQACINLCSAYGKLGNLKEAVAYGEKAVKIDPQSALAHMNLAVSYFYTKEYALASRHCDIASGLGYRIDPKFLEELKARGRE